MMMNFWQVFEAYRPPVHTIFGQSLPNWKMDPKDAEDGLKLHLDGEYPDYALVYVNFAGTVVAEVNNRYMLTGSASVVEDKLRDLGIMKCAGYDDCH